MKKGPTIFQINLSSRYRWYLEPTYTGLALCVVLLVCGIGWSLWQLSDLYDKEAQLEPALARVLSDDQQFVQAAATEGFNLSESALQRLPGQVAFANTLIATKAFSWTTFLGELEQTVPTGLAIGGIQNDYGTTIQIHLTGTARSMDEITAFTLALQAHHTFVNPQLTQHRVGGNQLFDFTLTVGYRGQDR